MEQYSKYPTSAYPPNSSNQTLGQIPLPVKHNGSQKDLKARLHKSKAILQCNKRSHLPTTMTHGTPIYYQISPNNEMRLS